MFFKDTRDYQILFLATFLILGVITRDLTLQSKLIAVTIASCFLTQWLCSVVSQWKKVWEQKEDSKRLLRRLLLPSCSWRSSLITSLSLSLLLRAEHWRTMAFAAAAAIASKFIFKAGDKHFFNPANFGIICALVFTGNAWVSPGQWGEDWWYGLLFAGTGGIVLKRVGRWDTTAAFLGVYAFLEAVRNLWLGWTWDVYQHRLMSGSLLLFALFMVTDPRSIPNARIGRIIWAACIAVLTFVLRNYFYISTAVFWALFILAPLTILLDRIWEAPRFGWKQQLEVERFFSTNF